MAELERPIKYKDPDAVLDFSFDWGRYWLSAGETVVTSTFTASVGITIDSQSNTLTTTTAWLSGGKSGTPYTLTNHVTTSAGRTDERSMTVKVTNR